MNGWARTGPTGSFHSGWVLFKVYRRANWPEFQICSERNILYCKALRERVNIKRRHLAFKSSLPKLALRSAIF